MPMAFPPNPNDRFFRKIGSAPEVAAGMTESFLPEDIRPLVDISTLEVVKGSFVADDLREYRSDLLCKIRMPGRDGFIYHLFEHKSLPERFTHPQVLGYIRQAWDLRTGPELPFVIPVVIYHGQSAWNFSHRFSEVYPAPSPEMRRFFPDFEVVLVDLARFSEERIKGAVLARLFLLLLKHVHAPDFVERMPRIFELWKNLDRSRTGIGYLEAMLRYVVRVADDVPPGAIRQVIDDLLPGPEGDGIMTTLAERWKREGRLEGQAEGKVEGKAEGKAEALHMAIADGLDAKFGKAGSELGRAVREIHDVDRLRELMKVLWSAASLEEFGAMVKGRGD